ncbi:MAG: RNA ligase family protein [Bacteroidales bacterium]|jgi:hypothetical protein
MQRYKYPRTYHLPNSPGATSDDKVHQNVSFFEGKQIVITEKRDGENTTIYPDGYLHARSIDSKNHPSRNYIKNVIVPKIQGNIDDKLRICGENLFAKHAIFYNDLVCYFEVFGIYSWARCLSWHETEELVDLLDLQLVPVLYKGLYTKNIINETIEQLDFNRQEGFVIRTEDSFEWDRLNYGCSAIAKYVRKGHVQEGSDHWQHSQIIQNKLITDKGKWIHH